MENKEIAGLLSETADLMEVAGEDGFRIRSYRNAASAILSYPERIADIRGKKRGEISSSLNSSAYQVRKFPNFGR